MATALTLSDQIRRGNADFFIATQHAFKRSGQPRADLFAAIRRRDAPEEIRDSLFQSPHASVLDPVRDGDRFAIVRVLSVAPARLDKVTRETIENILFDDWLEERRKNARIEWFWGTASKTDLSSRSNR